MKESVGKITSLFISQKNIKKRVTKNTLQLDSLGIKSDKYYNTNTKRSVLITSLSSYTLAQNHDITLPWGSLGENLLMEYNPYHLPQGSILEIGSVKLEISQNCTICEHLTDIDERLPILLQTDRGIFAKVVVEGTIRKGDNIYLLS